ncbi:MAG: hypothetical protein FWC44_00730 [Methanomassiliicoccaceae archaeon]|nr:hypothetical protein [Methanomassiliicoccaceae archaeon]
MDLKSIQLAITNKKTETADAELTEDVLLINCRKCSSVPDIRSTGCLKCMIHQISEKGSAERIRLRTSKDIEIFGSAAETLCELAHLYRSTAYQMKKEGNRSCSDCNNSCPKIMEIVWSGFPDPSFDSARGRLSSFRPTDMRCNSCIQRTYRAIDQTEHGVNKLKKRISIEAARTGGV